MNSPVPFKPIQPLSTHLEDQNNFLGSASSQGTGNVPFENYLGQFYGGVNNTINNTGSMLQDAMVGKITNLHSVMASAAEAKILLELATAVTSKVTTAATTLFQMQF
jgi:flagellar hook-basal body complex protein FliE